MYVTQSLFALVRMSEIYFFSFCFLLNSFYRLIPVFVVAVVVVVIVACVRVFVIYLFSVTYPLLSSLMGDSFYLNCFSIYLFINSSYTTYQHFTTYFLKTKWCLNYSGCCLCQVVLCHSNVIRCCWLFTGDFKIAVEVIIDTKTLKGRKTVLEIDGQIDSEIEIHGYRQRNRRTDRQIDKATDRRRAIINNCLLREVHFTIYRNISQTAPFQRAAETHRQ